jgi:hypothetical protein
MTVEDLVAEVAQRRAAEQALADAVDDLAMHEQRTPCCDPDVNDMRLWTSESPRDRARACVLCASCPVITECRTYGATLAKGDRWGVYGGIDRSALKPKPRGRPARSRRASPELVATT